MKAVLNFIKKDAVLTAAWVLAVISAFFVRPDAGYLDCIDWRSLGILWSLMVIMQALRDNGLFVRIGAWLLEKTTSIRQLIAVLIFLCFVSSMFITNDVALITFVPFAILILKQCGRSDLTILTLVLQTVAANLGSMLTPVGNPQNLYLYGISGMGIGAFFMNMLPYTMLSALLLGGFILAVKRGDPGTDGTVMVEGQDALPELNRRKLVLFLALFVLALLTVLRLVPFYVLAAVVLVSAAIAERRTLKEVDYALLLTFVGFFIFTGNMARIAPVREALETVVRGHEVIAGVLASQFISNVPAALMLSGFTGEYAALILGVNFGGLGTLIASMASLISYKQFAGTSSGMTGRYLGVFTAVNLIFLAVLLAAFFVIR